MLADSEGLPILLLKFPSLLDAATQASLVIKNCNRFLKGAWQSLALRLSKISRSQPEVCNVMAQAKTRQHSGKLQTQHWSGVSQPVMIFKSEPQWGTFSDLQDWRTIPCMSYIQTKTKKILTSDIPWWGCYFQYLNVWIHHWCVVHPPDSFLS